MSSGRLAGLPTTPAERGTREQGAVTPVAVPAVLPAFAAAFAVDLSGSSVETVVLPPELRGAALKRQHEHRAGRFCAVRALGILGITGSTAVARGTNGEPIWPAGVTGSITHGGGLAWAAVAMQEHAVALGIDSERLAERPQIERLSAHVLLPSEMRLGGDILDRQLRFTLVFSAKEALYKCLFPLVRRRFYFPDVEIRSVDAMRGTFGAEIRKTLGAAFQAGRRIEGRFAVGEGCLHTGVWLAAEGRTSV